MSKKALVLSGGGARGAYHVGVIEALVAAGWMEDGVGPDIIAGTSIGSINAAALASGMTVAQLKNHWLGMHTEDVHRLSSDLPPFARPLVGFLMHSVLTSDAHSGASAAPPNEPDNWLQRLGQLFRNRSFRSLLDTAPWRYTLESWFDFARINSPTAPALLVTATELQTGALRVFCNRPLNGQPAEQLNLDHLMASSSIPIVYPWTTLGAQSYWDGAVLANTPLEPVIDLAGGDEDLDILVVMMTPWNADPQSQRGAPMPEDIVQALTLTLDWALLASYRVAFEMLQHRNELATLHERLDRAAGLLGDAELRMPHGELRRVRLPTVIAPETLMPLEWIIDYEDTTHRHLFALGYADAMRALAQRDAH